MNQLLKILLLIAQNKKQTQRLKNLIKKLIIYCNYILRVLLCFFFNIEGLNNKNKKMPKNQCIITMFYKHNNF